MSSDSSGTKSFPVKDVESHVSRFSKLMISEVRVGTASNLDISASLSDGEAEINVTSKGEYSDVLLIENVDTLAPSKILSQPCFEIDVTSKGTFIVSHSIAYDPQVIQLKSLYACGLGNEVSIKKLE